jgi:hypothetical protein
MVVTAVNLFTGKVIAGPVATKADGSYKLGFRTAPDKNIGIVAGVSVSAPVARYTYATLVPPEAKPVVTSDTTRAITRYMLGVLPGRIQPTVDRVKAGLPPLIEDRDTPFEKTFKELLGKVPPEKMAAADKMPDGKDGAVALGISQRILAFLDLTTPQYQDFYKLTEEARLFGESIQPPLDPSLVDQAMALARNRQLRSQLPGLLEKYGMPADRATQLSYDMDDQGSAIGQQILQVMVLHQQEVFGPVEAL